MTDHEEIFIDETPNNIVEQYNIDITVPNRITGKCMSVKYAQAAMSKRIIRYAQAVTRIMEKN